MDATTSTDIFRLAADLSSDYIDSIPSCPVSNPKYLQDPTELRKVLWKDLTDEGIPPEQVLQELHDDVVVEADKNPGTERSEDNAKKLWLLLRVRRGRLLRFMVASSLRILLQLRLTTLAVSPWSFAPFLLVIFTCVGWPFLNRII